MKLLLASNGSFLINQGYKLLGIPKDKIRIGYVITASKKVSDKSYLEKHKRDMDKQGYHYKEIDIENKSTQEIEIFFKDKNIIHVEGGHTFYLLQAIKKSGFDKLLKNFINEGKIYVGTSAGTSIAGPTIELSSHVPKDVTKKDLAALHIVPFLTKCHYTEEKKDSLEEQLSKTKYPVKILRDGQGLLIEDGSYHLIGKGEEVQLKYK